ncbi:vesicular-fusion protein-like protein sec18 [Pseudomassariella vexata]|uniref:Vesicular-fusion protein SEC18 n=1 Tax=Pseudomassariella vexata TaxID=1141098 RepID=A0A1Y2DC86_9PEZI|nr:vesicular-fusion protein-like protein sec18 [Pseudomassariella vexata]ORY56880.1 vesicular-fusion protein-like protein sec18 [Pseudomassariella vexata]
MDLRNNLFGKGPRGGLPGRQVPGGPPSGGGYGQAPPPPSRDNYSQPQQQRPPPTSPGYGGSPAAMSRPQRSSGGYGGQPAGASTGYSSAPAIPLRMEKLPKGSLADQYIFSNLSAVSQRDFPSRDGNDVYVLLRGAQMQGEYVVTARPTPGFPDGCISLSDPQRQWCGIGLTDTFTGEQYDPFSQGKTVYLGILDVEISFASQRKITDTPYDQDQLSDIFLKQYQSQIFSPGQRFLMDLKGIPLSFVVKAIQLVDLSMEKGASSSVPSTSAPNARGILTNMTTINFFKGAQSPIKLKGSARRPAANAIIRPDFKFEDMGIGGLDDEFSTIFRRAFLSRIMPPGIVEQMGLPHVKGLLLFGPPGTGKTLIARQIGKMLNAREPKIINGPEILNKFVGQSEENVRKMFADAEKEYKEKGEESELHIIIFDELDAVCKQRGSSSGGTGVGDSVVNQLLTKLDGVEQLNNILLIGMTNRKDMIDEALLRPGRLEVHVEISLPDEHGRQQILKIHTNKLRVNGRLAGDVNIGELAAKTKNFSGAEIIGLVKAAASYAFGRNTKMGGMAVVPDNIQDMQVEHADFLRALDDVKPAFGVSEEALVQSAPWGIIPFSPHIQRIRDDGQAFADQISKSEDLPLFSVLLHGPRGSGKTALAADIGLKSDFPFVKLVSAKDMPGMGETGKIEMLKRVFSDAYKSQISMVILDDIDDMIEWSPVGPRFQNSVLNAIALLLKTKPPKRRRLLIIGTTSRRGVLQQLDIRGFNREIAVPAVSDHRQLTALLSNSGAFPDPAEINESVYELQNLIGSDRVDVGVSEIIATLKTSQSKAKRDQRPLGQIFAGELADVINMNNM